jgi:hypothetical protein
VSLPPRHPVRPTSLVPGAPFRRRPLVPGRPYHLRDCRAPGGDRRPEPPPIPASPPRGVLPPGISATSAERSGGWPGADATARTGTARTGRAYVCHHVRSRAVPTRRRGSGPVLPRPSGCAGTPPSASRTRATPIEVPAARPADAAGSRPIVGEPTIAELLRVPLLWRASCLGAERHSGLDASRPGGRRERHGRGPGGVLATASMPPPPEEVAPASPSSSPHVITLSRGRRRGPRDPPGTESSRPPRRSRAPARGASRRR